MNENLGDDLDLIDVSCLGEAYTSITDTKNTVLTIDTPEGEIEVRMVETDSIFGYSEEKPNDIYIGSEYSDGEHATIDPSSFINQ
jgi:hypothetical protein